MKAKTKNKTKKTGSRRTSIRSRNTREPRGTVEDRDLNEDEQHVVTNSDKDDDLGTATAPGNSSDKPGFTVEEEEEREKRRKVEDRHPEERTNDE